MDLPPSIIILIIENTSFLTFKMFKKSKTPNYQNVSKYNHELIVNTQSIKYIKLFNFLFVLIYLIFVKFII